MELNRLRRILRDRWIVVAVIAFLGAVGAWAFTGLANQQRVSRWEAVTALAFSLVEGQTIADQAQFIDQNHDLALIAAADLMAEDQGSAITVDLAGARLVFTALGETQSEAGGKAMGLMGAFLGVDPLLAGLGVDQRLEQLRSEASEIEATLKELTEEIDPPIDPATRRQAALIDLQIEAFNSALVSLTVARTTSTGADRDAIESQMANVESALSALLEQRAELSVPTEPGTPTAQQQLELVSLQSHLAQLQQEYQRLFLRTLGYTENAQTEPTVYTDLTAGPGSPLVNASIGLFGGLAVALFGLIFINNTRKTIWLPEDLTVPVLADVPGRRTVSGVGPSWYDNTGSSPRKTAIQALRSSVEARLAGTSGAVAIAGNRIGSAAVHALVTDLAVSMSSAGSSVLLVDADLESDSALAEYHVGGPSLSAILKLNSGSLSMERQVASIVDDAYLIRTNLAVLPSGPPPATPADALAGRQFRAFVNEASKRFDYVVVAVGEGSSTAAQVAMQRLGRAIIVLTPGRSIEPQVNSLLSDVAARQVATLGAIFVQRSEGPVQGRDGSVEVDSSLRRPRPEESTSSPLSRLGHYPIPVEKHSGLVPSTSLRSLADRVGSATAETDNDLVRVDEAGDGFGSELQKALSDASPAEAYEAVADYLITRVEDMMVAVPGQGDFSSDLTGDLHDNGFLPLRNVAGHRSVGEWLVEELQREAAGSNPKALVDEMERILGFGFGVDTVTFDDWLSTEFFSRHLRRTNGDPYIWHIVSKEGTGQILAHSMRFDTTSAEILISDVARQMIDRLERDLKASKTAGRLEDSIGIEQQLAEIRQFEVAIGSLIGLEQEGVVDDSRARRAKAVPKWNPNWSLGLRENLAPIQRAGLLPFPVLSEEEMDTFLAVV